MIKKFSDFIGRVYKWEYWPFGVLYLPIIFYYLILSIRERSLFFFTSSNPSIEFGGMFGERKSDIFKIIPENYIPKTVLISRKLKSAVLEKASDIGFPLIVKPDIGERGAWVKVINNEKELLKYHAQCPVDFLLQELVTYPLELGIFYVRDPECKMGTVTSIVRKQFLKVKGNGINTIEELLQDNQRARFNFLERKEEYSINWDLRLPAEAEMLIEPIGNHCKGTTFLNDNHEIDQNLINAIDKLAKQIPEFYYGRFDLRCESYQDLKQLKKFSILELNGAGAEPAHIYQPGFSLMKAYGTLFWHFNMLARISRKNKTNGVAYWSFIDGFKLWQAHKKHNLILATK